MAFRLAYYKSKDQVTTFNDEIIAAQWVTNTPHGTGDRGDCREGVMPGDFDRAALEARNDARATDCATGLKVWGRIEFNARVKDMDSTDPVMKLAGFALFLSEAASAYSKFELSVIDGGQTVRKYVLSNAFAVEYNEDIDDEEGVGHFYLHLRQKKADNENIQVTGGFEAKGYTR